MLLRLECWLQEEVPLARSEEQEELLTCLSVIDGLANPEEAANMFAALFNVRNEYLPRIGSGKSLTTD